VITIKTVVVVGMVVVCTSCLCCNELVA